MDASSNKPHLTAIDGELPSFQELVDAELAVSMPMRRARRQPRLVSVAELERLLPRFEQFEFLGVGGMGIVYKAWQSDLRRWVAVKLLAPDVAQDPRALDRFRNEASILAQLRHPNIVPIHDFGADGDLAFLVMEYIEGVSLTTWTEQQSPSVRMTAAMMARIARATGVAHASGITHRDLKPGNILVTADQQPVIIDFGLAQHAAWQQAARFTQTGELAGTAAYLAPEQVDSSLGELCPATDVHACGVMAFELLTGKLPRQGTTAQIIARLHNDEFPPRLSAAKPHASPELEAVCWKAMQRHPADRYATGAALADDLDRFNEGRPVKAKRPAMMMMAWQGMRRRPGLSAAVALCAASILFAIGSGRQSLLDQRKSRLISQVNRSLTSKAWTPAALNGTEDLLRQFETFDSAYAQHLREDVMERTAAEVAKRLDDPQPAQEDVEATGKLIDFLSTHSHHQAADFAAVWQARQKEWQMVAALTAPVTDESAAKVFSGSGWRVDDGKIATAPSAGATSKLLVSRVRVKDYATVRAEFDGPWQKAGAHVIAVRSPHSANIRFCVSDARHFRGYVPGIQNPGDLPVMAIMRDTKPLMYQVLSDADACAERLHIDASYSGGEIAMEVNGGSRIRVAGVFIQALPVASIALLLPVQTRLCRLEVKQRHPDLQAPPFSTADHLVAMGKAGAALPVYEKYLNRANGGLEARYKRGYCLNAMGRIAEAQEDWKNVASAEQEPWRSLSCFELWRSCVVQGNLRMADAWFDLLTARQVPPVVKSAATAADRQLLNETYLHGARSLNCLRLGPGDSAVLQRAMAVQDFLGFDRREIAARIAPAFHFAGQDQRARQMCAAAISSMRPAEPHDPRELHMAMSCLDRWAALGDCDQDASLHTAASAWEKALSAKKLPARAAPQLVLLRRQLRGKATADSQHLAMLGALASDSAIPLRYRTEALLLAGFAHERMQRPEEARRQWQSAIEALDRGVDRSRLTQALLHTELVARCLMQGWDAQSAIPWLQGVLNNASGMSKDAGWTGGIVQALPGEALADALNAMLAGESGHRLACDYALRQRPARDLAEEAMSLFLQALMRTGTGLPPESMLPAETAGKLVKAFCHGDMNEVALMQFFTLWSGRKNFVTWEMLAKPWPPDLRHAVASIMERRFRMLHQAAASAEFGAEAAILSGSQ